MGTLTMYAKLKLALMNKTTLTDFDSGSVKMMLLTSVYTPDALVDKFVSEIVANEVSAGTTYTAGGEVLANPTAVLIGANAVFDADDMTLGVDATGFTNARYFVFYHDTGVPATSELIAYGDYSTDKSITDASLITSWDAAGIIEW